MGQWSSYRIGKLCDEQREEVNANISNYMQNTGLGMTKDQYFEMCEALGTQPLDSEIPLEIDDFPSEVQEAFAVHSSLQDNWDTMNGHYLGKDLSMFLTVYRDILHLPIEDIKVYFDLVLHIDSVKRKLVADSKPKDNPKP